MRQCEQIIPKLCIPACPCEGGNYSREVIAPLCSQCSLLPGRAHLLLVRREAVEAVWEPKHVEKCQRDYFPGVCPGQWHRSTEGSWERGGGAVHALVSACKGAGTKWSSFIASKAQLSHNEFLFTVGREMCGMVLLSFLNIKAGRKRGFMQKDLSGLLPPPPSPSRKPDSPREIIWQVQW